MNLTKIISNAGKYVRSHKDICLYGVGLAATVADAILTYYSLNGNPYLEYTKNVRHMMITYGIGPTLSLWSSAEAAIVAGFISNWAVYCIWKRFVRLCDVTWSVAGAVAAVRDSDYCWRRVWCFSAV